LLCRGTIIPTGTGLVAERKFDLSKSLVTENPIIPRLDAHVGLAPEEVSALAHLCRHRRSYVANTTLVDEGARMSVVFVILSGVAFRYKMLVNGKRQIFGYLMPGDMCDADFIISDRCDHSVCVLTQAEVAVVQISELNSCIAKWPRIGRALALSNERDGSVLRDWLLNIGQRHALQRIAHFLVQMSGQLQPGKRMLDGSLPMPLTQHELADTIGLTVVHVNRCLQKLRDEGAIAWGRRRVTIVDYDRLLQISGAERHCSSFEASSRSALPTQFAEASVTVISQDQTSSSVENRPEPGMRTALKRLN
jgi:CRP-like cAMP-binding protein